MLKFQKRKNKKDKQIKNKNENIYNSKYIRKIEERPTTTLGLNTLRPTTTFISNPKK